MKVAVTTVGTEGDIRHFEALAKLLMNAGHQVTVFSFGLYQDRFVNLGVDFCAVGPDVTIEDIRKVGLLAAQSPRAVKQVEILAEFHLREAERHYLYIRKYLPGHDLVVTHTIHTLAQAAAVDCEIPWVGIRFDPTLIPTAYSPPTGMPNMTRFFNPWFWRLVDSTFRPVDSMLNNALKSAGSQVKRARLFRAISPWLNIVACSPAICPLYKDLPDHFLFTGSWQKDQSRVPPSIKLQKFIEQGLRPIVVTFGSMTGGEGNTLASIIIEAIQITGQRAVIQRGVAGLNAKETTENIIFVDYEPHNYLFANAACVIHHGGSGTSHAACAAGVPSIVIPHIGDQFYWANRLNRIGVSPSPVPLRDLSASTLAKTIDYCTNNKALILRAQQLAEQMRAENGLETTMNALNQVVIP